MHRVTGLIGSLAWVGCTLVLGGQPAWAGVVASAGDGPGGTVSVGASAAGGTAGAPGGRSGGSASSSGSPWSCTYTYLALNNEGGMPSGGPLPGAWYSVTCVDLAIGVQSTETEWISSRPGGVTPPVDPRAVALQAERSLVLPRPLIHTDPSGTALVNLPTWLWIDPALWHPDSVTATVGPVSATALATPTSVWWSTGDGGGTHCDGPGIPYDALAPERTTLCSYQFSRTSAGQQSPDGHPDDAAFVITATVTWSITWSATGAVGGGQLPPLFTSGTGLLRVAQVESVNTIETTGVP